MNGRENLVKEHRSIEYRTGIEGEGEVYGQTSKILLLNNLYHVRGRAKERERCCDVLILSTLMNLSGLSPMRISMANAMT